MGAIHVIDSHGSNALVIISHNLERIVTVFDRIDGETGSRDDTKIPTTSLRRTKVGGYECQSFLLLLSGTVYKETPRAMLQRLLPVDTPI